jgi:class 3 adenylate cyclase
MQQVTDWLEKLGMSEYAQRFAENGINFAALRHLTDPDLKDIGVLLGHRRIVLAAVAELGGSAMAAPAHSAAVEPKPQDTAERRQVTVMFSDLVGSTALSARMDPEDLREVISAYQKCVAETVQRFGGCLYLLSDQSSTIARLDRLRAGGGTATFLDAWRLGDLDGKPEGLAFTAQGRAIVGLDTRKPRRNLVLLEPPVAQLPGRGQS